MKANELMIGDWVFIKDYPIKALPKKVRPEHFVRSLVEFEPIPLTPEILEKNGFEVQDQGGGRKDVWTGFGIDCEGDIEVEFQYNIPIHLKIDGGFKGEYYTSANIKYIHQLQHALRLCGSDKTIEL